MSDIRAVFDANTLVSAVLRPGSVPHQAFDAAMKGCKVLASVDTLMELDRVLRRTKFDKYVSLEKRLDFLAAVDLASQHVEITEQVTECRDPKDDKYLDLALSGNATHIVSGDHDLLALHPFRKIDILTPQQFLAIVAAL